MKLLIFALFLTIIAPAQLARDTAFTSDMVNFHNHWNTFMREYFGCPKDATDVDQCEPHLGVINYGEYNKVRKAAKKLFHLTEKE